MTDRHRDAITGKFVTAEHAEANHDTTVGDHSELRARAEACPPEDVEDSIWYSEDRLAFAIGTRDRPFVAACSPTVVLGLLDELDRLGGVVHAQKVAIDGYRDEVERLAGRIKAAEAALKRVWELHRESRGSMSALYPNLICECCKDYLPLDIPCEVLS